MKVYFAIAFLLLGTRSSAQNIEVVTDRGFHDVVMVVDTFPGNQWVFAGVTFPAHGSTYRDTITIWICDSTAKVLRTMTSVPPLIHEFYTIDHLISLPDSSVLLQYSGGDCDACCYSQVLERWDKNGNRVWQKISPDNSWETIFGITKNNRLFCQVAYDVSEIDLTSGDYLWQHQFTNDYYAGVLFVPGTANFLIHDGANLRYYEMDTTGGLTYILKATRSFPNYTWDFKADQNGNIYTLQDLQFPKLYRFPYDLDTVEVFSIPYVINDYSPVTNGIITLIKQGPNFILTSIDSFGQSSTLYTNSNPEIWGWKLKYGNTGVGVVGQYQAGPHASHLDSQQGWFRYFQLDSIEQPDEKFSLSITDIKQEGPIIIDSNFIDTHEFTGYLYDYTGGNFEILITNTGNQPVDSFWINTRLDNAYKDWCGLEYCKDVFIHSRIDPGNSAWVEFGDLTAVQRYQVQNQFCFWTSGPNARPDDISFDDWKCVDRIVSNEEPAEDQISLYPNPAGDHIIITNAELTTDALPFSIFSPDGKIWKKDSIQSGSIEKVIDIHALPNGYYILQVGNQLKSFVKS